jgi:hypothetical protein
MKKLAGESPNEYNARVDAQKAKITELSKAYWQATLSESALNRELIAFNKVGQNSLTWFTPFHNVLGGVMGELKSAKDLIKNEFNDGLFGFFAKDSVDADLAMKNVSLYFERMKEYAKEGGIKGETAKASAEDAKKRLLAFLGLPEETEISKIPKEIYSTFFGKMQLQGFEGFQQLAESGDLQKFFEMGLIPEDVITSYLESLKKLKDNEEELLQQRVQNWSDLGSHIGDIMSSIGDIYEIDLENRKKNLEKNGKYDEEAQKQLEKEYKKVQAMKIAQATINTISGALAAFMGYQELGQPWGGILGAAAAAAVMASGIAQIHQIANTNPYSDNSSSLNASVAAATPSLNEYTPNYTENLTNRNETTNLANALSKQKLYVSVTDIDNVQNTVHTREEEATF